MTLMSKWRVWPWGALAGVGVVALVVLLRFVFLAPGTAQASSSVLSVISPPVEVQGEGEASPRPAVDGEILHAGDLVRTGAGGRAVITFYEGTTATLEPGTEVVIQAMERRGAGGFFTSLQQSIGVTWNRVVELADPASGYEVETPAGTGTVRGTAFKVVVGEEPQRITLEEPKDGTYQVFLAPREVGDYHLRVLGLSEDEQVFGGEVAGDLLEGEWDEAALVVVVVRERLIGGLLSVPRCTERELPGDVVLTEYVLAGFGDGAQGPLRRGGCGQGG